MYMLIELKKPKDQLSTPLAAIVIGYITLVSLIHVYSAFVIVFQLHTVILLAIGISGTLYYRFKEPQPENSDTLLKTWILALVIAGSSWVRQMHPSYFYYSTSFRIAGGFAPL